MKMTHLTIVQREPAFLCIAMAEGGLATAQIARKQASNTVIYHQISRHQMTADRPQ